MKRCVLPCWVWDDCPRFYPPMWREILQPFCTANSRSLFRQQPKILSHQSLRRWISVLPLSNPNFPVSEHIPQRIKQTKTHILKQFRNHKQYFLSCATTNLNNYNFFSLVLRRRQINSEKLNGSYQPFRNHAGWNQWRALLASPAS